MPEAGEPLALPQHSFGTAWLTQLLCGPGSEPDFCISGDDDDDFPVHPWNIHQGFQRGGRFLLFHLFIMHGPPLRQRKPSFIYMSVPQRAGGPHGTFVPRLPLGSSWQVGTAVTCLEIRDS